MQVETATPARVRKLHHGLVAVGLASVILMPGASGAQSASSRCGDRLCSSALALVEAAVRIHREVGCARDRLVLLRELRSSPVPRLRGDQAPVIMDADDLQLWRMIAWYPTLTLEDSTAAFADSAGTGRNSCVIALSPPDWLDTDRMWFQAFVHQERFGEGQEFIVNVRIVDGRIGDVHLKLGRIQRVQRE
jgi:hypothetical protein